MSSGRVAARRPPGSQENTCPGCGHSRVGNVCLWCNKCWTCGTKLKFSHPQRPYCENPECPDVQKKGTPPP